MKKILIYLSTFLLGLQNVFGVIVQETKQQIVSVPTVVEESGSWGYLIFAMIITLILVLIIYIIYKIIEKANAPKKLDDTEYFKYYLDLKSCIVNLNPRYKYRKWYTFFLTWNKAQIFAETKDGKKFIGYYEGDCIKKEGVGWYCVAFTSSNRGIKGETDVLIMPYEFKHIVRFNNDFSITILCEGVDETLSSEYWSMPIILNPQDKTNRTFLDFSDLLQREYFDTFIHRDVIKELAISYKDNIKTATDMNSMIHHNRKNQKPLDE